MTSLRRVSHAAIAILCLFVFLFGTEASAQTSFTTTTGGHWTAPSTWLQQSGYPGTNDNVTINGGTLGTPIVVTIPSNITIASLTISGFVTLKTDYTLTVTGGTTISNGTLYLEYGSAQSSQTILAMYTLNLNLGLNESGIIAPGASAMNLPVKISLGGTVMMGSNLQTTYIAHNVHAQITHTTTLFRSDVRFDGVLEFPQTSNKLFNLGANNLYLGKLATLIIAPVDGAGYIATTSSITNSPAVGHLCREVDPNQNIPIGPFEFPVGATGSNEKYVPIKVTINSYTGTFNTNAYPFPHIAVRVVSEKHPANMQTGADFNLYWVVKGVGTPDQNGGSVCVNVDMTYHNYYRTGGPAPLYSARFTPFYETNTGGVWDLTGSQISTTGGNVRWVTMGAVPPTTCGVPGFGDFTIAVGNDPLPVELTSFSARYVRNTVELKWLTATELNNYGFAIERSLDGRSWTEVDFVPGAGNSFSPRSYSWTDKLDDDLLRSGKLAYRLLQMDRDGSTEYSNIVYVNLGPAPTAVQLHEAYPNPFNPATTVSFTLPEAGPASVTVHNVFGQEVVTLLDNASLDAGVHTVSFNGDKLPSGSYIVVLKAGDVVRHQRIVLSK